MRRRLRELEEMEKLEHQIEEARKRLGITKGKRRRLSDSSSSSDSGTRTKAIKITNITPFTAKTTYRLRQEWLSDLNRAFRGDTKRFRTDTNKILFALDHMDRQPRNRWESHIRTMPEEERDIAESSWSTFEKWTTTCVVDLADQASQIAKLLNSAQQRENQSPWDFHSYLESLENHNPLHDDKARAMLFYTKLDPKIIHHIDRYYATNRPETREAMVRLANQIWRTLPQSSSKHHGHGSHSSQPHDHNNYRPTHQPQHPAPETPKPEPSTPTPEAWGKRACYTCGSTEHLARDCQQAPQVNNTHTRGGGHRGSGRSHRGNGRRPW